MFSRRSGLCGPPGERRRDRRRAFSSGGGGVTAPDEEQTGQRRFAPNFLMELFSNPLDPGYADAAARRARYGPRPPWRRRGAFGLRVVALMAVGFLLPVAYREAVAAAPDRTSAHAGPGDEVKAAQARTDRMQPQRHQP